MQAIRESDCYIMNQYSQYISKCNNLSADSRFTGDTWCFFALNGLTFNGEDFIEDAIQNGAVSVVTSNQFDATNLQEKYPEIAFHKDPNLRLALSKCAALVYPDQPETIAMITGTNGKTSTADFLRQIWEKLGYTSASVGTIGIRSPVYERDGTLTTPDPVQLHQDLQVLKQKGVTHVAMEASSHGLDQYRLHAINAKVGAFTNLSRDHFDYHGTMDNYAAAKARLFTEVIQEGRSAVINAADSFSAYFIDKASENDLRIVQYGANEGQIYYSDHAYLPQGQRFICHGEGQSHAIHFPFIGQFQVENVLCALSIALACVEPDQRPELMTRICEFLSELLPVPGRLEFVPGHPDNIGVYIDYAHTPDALERVLQDARPHCQGKLWCVFGAGGDRDKGKRPLMGDAVAKWADIGIVTDDNPRSEDPAMIRKYVMGSHKSLKEIGNRRDAIVAALTGAEAGDIVIIAGKGHETGQTANGLCTAFSDKEEAEKVIQTLNALVTKEA